jgi:phage terminase small subunit
VTPKQEAFVREYLIDLNATQAAIRAGYSARTADVQGCRLLADVKVAKEIAKAMQAREKRTGITQDRVLQELARIAFFDPRDLLTEDGRPKPINELSADAAAVLVGMDITEETQPADGGGRETVGYTKKMKLADKVAALGLAMRHLGMLQTKVELTGNVTAAVAYQANIPRRGS